jgi:hypothetical protein
MSIVVRRRTGRLGSIAVVWSAALLFLAAQTAHAQVAAPPGPAPPDDVSRTAVEFPGPAATGWVEAPGDPGEGPAAFAPRVEMSLLGTIAESLLGDVYAEGRWRPLTLGTFFSEGWLEPWAAAPAGRNGLTPRHGWLGAFDGVFYRLWFTTFGYANHLNAPFGGNRYTGNYTIFLPFSRRFELLFDVPFVVSNGTQDPTRSYTSRFGDLTVTPRFLLSESAATSQTLALGIRTPTGSTGNGNGIMALTPRYEFWTNPGGPWVVRGSSGVFVPMNKDRLPVQTAFVGGLAAGRYFRPHDVIFGDLVFYIETNFLVPLDGGASRNTLFTVGPGSRFHIANNYFFLIDWDVPVTGNKPVDYTLQVALLKVF